ncbi:MAG TPA: hypothetical protein DCY07_03245 [Rhodospirillaceae bacterium]|nr:hypothetical protein [Rhodospirillaceae bacterium]
MPLHSVTQRNIRSTGVYASLKAQQAALKAEQAALQKQLNDILAADDSFLPDEELAALYSQKMKRHALTPEHDQKIPRPTLGKRGSRSKGYRAPRGDIRPVAKAVLSTPMSAGPSGGEQPLPEPKTLKRELTPRPRKPVPKTPWYHYMGPKPKLEL